MPLNERQRRFVDFYLVSLNASQAALDAGYSPKTAYSQGFDLLKKPEVQRALQEASQQLAKRTGIEQEDVIREFQRLAFTNIRDYVDVTEGGVRIKPSSEWTDDQARAVASVREMVHQGGVSTIDLRLHDKQKALAEMSARLWPKPTEQVIVTTREAEDKLLEHYTIEELEAFLVMARKQRMAIKETVSKGGKEGK